VRKLLNVYFLLFFVSFLVCYDVVPSLSEDPTPLAESINQLHFELEGDGKGEAANKLDLSTVTGATGGLSSADESLKTPNGLQPLVDSTPIKSPGEVRQPPKQTPIHMYI